MTPRRSSVLSFASLVAGEWVKAHRAALKINPSDLGDTVGDYEQAGIADPSAALEAVADIAEFQTMGRIACVRWLPGPSQLV